MTADQPYTPYISVVNPRRLLLKALTDIDSITNCGNLCSVNYIGRVRRPICL